VRAVRVWKAVLGVQHTVIEGVDLEPAGAGEVLVARVRPTRSRTGRCGRCGRRGPGYDRGQGRRRWRGLDLGTTAVYLEADVPHHVPSRRSGMREVMRFPRGGAFVVGLSGPTASPASGRGGAACPAATASSSVPRHRARSSTRRARPVATSSRSPSATPDRRLTAPEPTLAGHRPAPEPCGMDHHDRPQPSDRPPERAEEGPVRNDRQARREQSRKCSACSEPSAFSVRAVRRRRGEAPLEAAADSTVAISSRTRSSTGPSGSSTQVSSAPL